MNEQRPAGSHARPRRGVALKAALACCAAVLTAGASGCASEDEDPGDVAPPTSPTPSAGQPADAGPPTTVVRPDGFAGLRLGMSVEEVRATGDATMHEDAGGRCRTFTLTGDLPAADAGSATDGFVSEEYGLVAVFARPGLDTEEGVGVGSTLAELRAAYPAGHSETGWFRVSLPGGGEYEFGIGSDDVVESLAVRLVEQDCFD